MTLKTGLGVRESHWKCNHSIESLWLHIHVHSNYSSIAGRFWDIQCRKISRPRNPSQGQSRSLKLVPFDRLGIVSYLCSILTLSLSFWDIRLQKSRDLENRVKGPSRSLIMSPFNRARTTSYWRSIVTMALSRVVSEIFHVEKCRDLEIQVRGHSKSLKVVPFERLFLWFPIGVL